MEPSVGYKLDELKGLIDNFQPTPYGTSAAHPAITYSYLKNVVN